MTLTGLKLTAGLAALATMGLVACGGEGEMAGDDPLHDAQIARDREADSSTTTLDPATTPTPSDQMPNAPPEVVAPNGLPTPQDRVDPTDPTSPPTTPSPPVLPGSPPN